MDNAVTVLDQLLPLANFSYQLGLALKLSKEVVDQIHAEHQKAPDRLRHIIQIFLSNTQPPPTWRAIIEALQAPGLSRFQLANEIKKKFISPVDGNTGKFCAHADYTVEPLNKGHLGTQAAVGGCPLLGGSH